jgi:hypothetical protein
MKLLDAVRGTRLAVLRHHINPDKGRESVPMSAAPQRIVAERTGDKHPVVTPTLTSGTSHH